MGIIKRSIYAVKGYIGTYIVFFSLVFIFSNIIVVSKGLNQQSKDEIKQIKKTIGIRATIKSSLNSISEDGYHLLGDTPASQNQRITSLSNDYIALLETIREVPGVDYLDYSYLLGYTNIDNMNSWTTEDSVEGNDLYIMGISTVDFRYLKHDKIKIVEGRNITEEEIASGAPVGLIYGSKRLINKDTNEAVKVGDMISVNGNSEYSIEIIGSYEGTNPDNLPCREEECPRFSIFVPVGYLNALNHNEEKNSTVHVTQNWSGSIISDVEIEIKDIDSFAAIEKKMNEAIEEYQSEHSSFELMVDSSQIDELLTPLENLKKSTAISFYITVFGSTLIIVFIEFYLLRKRKKEMGVLLSMGETKNNIVLQLISEVFIVGGLALLLSIVSSFFIIENISRQYFLGHFSHSITNYVVVILVVLLSLLVGVLIPSISLIKLTPRNVMFEEE